MLINIKFDFKKEILIISKYVSLEMNGFENVENKRRYQNIVWYLEALGIDNENVIKSINK